MERICDDDIGHVPGACGEESYNGDVIVRFMHFMPDFKIPRIIHVRPGNTQAKIFLILLIRQGTVYQDSYTKSGFFG